MIFVNDMCNLPKFSCKCNKDLSSDQPKYSLPFASSVAIYQNFIPPKISYVIVQCTWFSGLPCGKKFLR